VDPQLFEAPVGPKPIVAWVMDHQVHWGVPISRGIVLYHDLSICHWFVIDLSWFIMIYHILPSTPRLARVLLWLFVVNTSDLWDLWRHPV
jgi:hypothetical protein